MLAVVFAAFGITQVLSAVLGRDKERANKRHGQRGRWAEGGSEMGLGLGRETLRDREGQRLRWEQRHTEAEPEGTAWAQRDRAGTARAGAAQSLGICEDQQWESRNNRTHPRDSCLGTEGGACLAGTSSRNSTDSTQRFLG